MKLLTKIHIDSVEINNYIGNKERENLLLESHGSNLNITPSIVLTPPVNSDASNLEYNRYSHELNHECITPGKGLPEEIVQYFEKQKNHPQKLSEYSKISLIIDRKLTRFPSLESIFDMDKPSPSEQTKGNFLAVPNDGGGESLSSSNSKILSQSDQLSTLSIDDFAKLTLRKEKKPHLYPVINKLTYINPSEVGIAGNWFEDDVPDPEMSFDEPDHTDTIPMIVASGGRTGRRPSDSSMESKGSLQHSEGSLPLERLFKSKPFRAVPTWVPVKPKYVAFCLLILTTTISIGNIVLNLPIYEEKVL
ncbi:hypothetical protein BC833DRAFT_144094 [Globomyces pollinis-pini]|nr:hypothetical protein BC833DRAFT_144094 [Globomyces pollinis-pini]